MFASKFPNLQKTNLSQDSLLYRSKKNDCGRFNLVPIEIFWIIFNLLDAKSQYCLTSSCRVFRNRVIAFTDRKKLLAAEYIAFANLLEKDVQELSEGQEWLIDSSGKQTCASKISAISIKILGFRIKQLTMPRVLDRELRKFKETCINAIADMSRGILDKISLLEKDFCIFSFQVRTIWKEGKSLVKGCVYLLPHSMAFYPVETTFGMKAIQVEGKSLEGEVPLLDVWCESKECQNWADYYPERFGLRVGDQCRFPDKLPAILFKGKKEGDQVDFLFNSHKVKLVCHQKGHRYSYGNFDVILKERVIFAWERSKNPPQEALRTKKDPQSFIYYDYHYQDELQKMKDEWYPDET